MKQEVLPEDISAGNYLCNVLEDGGEETGMGSIVGMFGGRCSQVSSWDVINTADVLEDVVRGMDSYQKRKEACPGRGIHIISVRKFSGSILVCVIPKTRDGRILFEWPLYRRAVPERNITNLNNSPSERYISKIEADLIANRIMQLLFRHNNIFRFFIRFCRFLSFVSTRKRKYVRNRFKLFRNFINFNLT